MNQPYILYLPAWYPHRYDNMFGLFVKRHAEISATDNRVVVLFVCGFENEGKAEIEETHQHQLHEYIKYYKKWKSGWPFLDSFIRFVQYFYHSFQLYRTIKKNYGKPRLSHVNILTRAGVVALILKSFQAIPYVITEHWSRYQPYPGTYNGVLRKWITGVVVKESSALSTVTKHLYAAMSHFGLSHPKFMVLNNVVDVKMFTPSDKPTHQPIITFINITCFEDKSKNISGLIQAVSQLTRIRKDFKCVLVGEGQDFQPMKKLSDDLGLTGQFVEFTGKLEGEALASKLRSSQFLVCSSHYENMPVVISEAMACGLPVLSTDVGGIREHIQENNGMLIPPGNNALLVDGLNEMLSKYVDFNPAVIRDYALKTFSPGAVALQLEELYKTTKHEA